MYDYGWRQYMPDVARWMQLDPLVEDTEDPYSYVYNNPIRFIDPDGKQNKDVIITGRAADAALNELQKAVSSELTLTKDNNGKVSYKQNNSSGKLSADAQQLVNAIDDHSVNVNVKAENTKITEAENLYIGGAFSGNKTRNLLSRDGSSMSAITETEQEVNPKVLGAMSDYFGKPGTDMLHEVTESYQGGIIARKLGHNAGPPSEMDGDNPFSVYNRAHYGATPQTTDGVQANFFDQNGNPTNILTKTGRAEFIITDSTNVKAPLIIQTYP